jgi:hypothetical protein
MYSMILVLTSLLIFFTVDVYSTICVPCKWNNLRERQRLRKMKDSCILIWLLMDACDGDCSVSTRYVLELL